jgi:CheY-specific phosphatase CheX
MIDELEDMLKNSVREVFCKMLKTEPVAIPLGNEPIHGETHIASSVGFTRVVSIYASADFASRLTAVTLELAPSDIDGDEVVTDCMGEIVNMIVGNGRRRLSRKGNPACSPFRRSCVGAIFPSKPSAARHAASCASDARTTRTWSSKS